MCRDDLRRQRGQRAANCIQKARAGRTSWLVRHLQQYQEARRNVGSPGTYNQGSPLGGKGAERKRQGKNERKHGKVKEKKRGRQTLQQVLGDHVLVETHLCHGAAHDGRSEVTVSLCFTSREPPAAVNAIYDSRYHGNVKDDVKECFISFPGKFASGWDVLNAAKVWRAFSCKLPKFVSKTCRRR
ncbi:unnamed protein product [Effrenium voratum]|nr:unnamed protein product [Effrenium voratum]